MYFYFLLYCVIKIDLNADNEKNSFQRKMCEGVFLGDIAQPRAYLSFFFNTLTLQGKWNLKMALPNAKIESKNY